MQCAFIQLIEVHHYNVINKRQSHGPTVSIVKLMDCEMYYVCMNSQNADYHFNLVETAIRVSLTTNELFLVNLDTDTSILHEHVNNVLLGHLVAEIQTLTE